MGFGQILFSMTLRLCFTVGYDCPLLEITGSDHRIEEYGLPNAFVIHAKESSFKLPCSLLIHYKEISQPMVPDKDKHSKT